MSAGPSAAIDDRQAACRGGRADEGERQPRASAAARTIVNASTISTVLARNTETTSEPVPIGPLYRLHGRSGRLAADAGEREVGAK